MKKIITITAISGGGKTTLQEGLMKKIGIKRPINFTTRKPRSDKELDEYIFLTKEQYFIKMEKGDFLEHTNYNGNWYGVSSTLPESDVCIVLDPVGREQVAEKVARLYPDRKLISIYLDIPEEVQRERLEKRGDDEEAIKARSSDAKWFSPSRNCIILDGTNTEKELIDEVCEILQKT